MAKKLVIVESPAKAKTIGSYLGSDYEVQASIGHIRDLLPNSKNLPEELKKKWWADYSVDVDAGFEPIYEVPKEKAAQVTKLRAAMKGKDTLVLATDEDREGESISWHLLEVLKPGKSVTVQRIAFHEITREAILAAMKNPRDLDVKLVEAQEARRILDRLYGYTLSPVLWSRVTKNLSAGRVQSPAVKLVVDREEARRRFMTGAYWDLKVDLLSGQQGFSATLRSLDGQRIAIGKDFDDETGVLKATKGQSPMLLDEVAARALEKACKVAEPWVISRLETKEGLEHPAPPFMTTTLQQDANRKFGYSADRTMRIAQQLYEGVDIGGEQVGLITYMRTDSLTLSKDAVDRIRGLIREEYPDCLPDQPKGYTSKVRNAQEAHEAIRPSDARRHPSQMARYLNDDQLKIYDLIWKRTVACQMKPAKVLKTEVGVDVTADGKKLTFETSGKQILFDGFRRVYLEDSDDPEAEKEGMERRLPLLKQGQTVERKDVQALGHETKPPARYTDATLIKKLEEMGIGRPSTYASIISTIVDRGYVRKAGKQLIPSFKAYLTMEVLEKNFMEFMELTFTSRMDEALDDIAEGKANSKEYLQEFFLGDAAHPGLKTIVDTRKREIPYPAFVVGPHPQTGQPILVRNGKNGDAFLQVGEGDSKKYGNVPDDLAPADLSVAKAMELLDQKSAPSEIIGFDPITGRRLILKNRQGYYLEVERTEEEIERKDRPRWVSLPQGVDPHSFSQEDLNFLCELPRNIGRNPDTGEDILFKLGKYGAYVECGEERRTIEDWKQGATLTVEEAIEALKQPKGRPVRKAAAGPLAEFGQLEGAAGPVRLLSGRFGPYVTDGETNATLPRGTDPAALTPEQAKELLDRKREAGPSTPRKGGRFKKAATKKAPAKKAPAKKAAPKKKKA